MKFVDLFGKATSRWIKYSEYDAVQSGNGDWYITPTKDALPPVYDPIEKAEEIVVEALNICLKLMSGAREFYNDERIIAEICVFAEKYGLLGFITGLPTTPEFMEYESVYLPKNRHTRKESMPSKEYAKLFFPFDDKLNENPNPNRRYAKEDGGILCLGPMITDDNQPLRSCKYCNRAFIAKHPKAEYCKPSCKNKHNVYKNRGKE